MFEHLFDLLGEGLEQHVTGMGWRITFGHGKDLKITRSMKRSIKSTGLSKLWQISGRR
jgi:hypothetical protein